MAARNPEIFRIIIHDNSCIPGTGATGGSFVSLNAEIFEEDQAGRTGLIYEDLKRIDEGAQWYVLIRGPSRGHKEDRGKVLKPVYTYDEITARAVIKAVEETEGRPRVTCAVWSAKKDGTRVIEGMAALEVAG